MTETPLFSAPPSAAPLPVILRRIAIPFLIFSIILTGLLLLSSILLLPTLTRVDAGGAKRTTEELRVYRDSLVAQITVKEREREESVLPFIDAEYESLKAMRASHPNLINLRERILQISSALVSEKDAVQIDSMALRPEEGTLTVKGDVRNVGPRSMTVLAQLIDELSKLPGVVSIDPPRYARQEDPKIGPHSPLDVTLHFAK